MTTDPPCRHCTRAACARCLWTGVRRNANAGADCPQCGSHVIVKTSVSHRMGSPKHWKEKA
jgi:DNA-directed RNA polymerase subunit RPC12/RpoP